jgi:hypothetical protein
MGKLSTPLFLLLGLLLVPFSAAQASPGFTKLANVSATTYTDSACPDLTTCFYQVTALDATGHESAGAACSSSALCLGGNQAVAMMPSSGTHTVTLNWAASTSTGVTYNVYVHVGPFPGSGLAATVN